MYDNDAVVRLVSRLKQKSKDKFEPASKLFFLHVPFYLEQNNQAIMKVSHDQKVKESKTQHGNLKLNRETTNECYNVTEASGLR